jgi:hypothetical protein
VVTPDRDSLIAKLGCRVVRYTALKNPYHMSLMNRKELKELVRKAGIPIPISKMILIPFSHHQLLIAIKLSLLLLMHQSKKHTYRGFSKRA